MLSLGRLVSARSNYSLLILACLLAIVPFHLAIASRDNLVVYQIIMLVIFGVLYLSDNFRLPIRYRRLLLGLGGMFVWITLSSLWAADKSSAFNASSIYGIAILLLMSLLIVFEQSRLRQVWLYGFLAVAAGASIIGLWSLHGSSVGRIQIGLMLSNAAAGYLLPAVVILAFDWRGLWPSKLLAKIGLTLAAIAIFSGFVLTFSRGSWLCLALISMFIIWRRWSARKAIVAGIIIVAVLLSLLGLSNHLAKTGGDNFLKAGLGRSTSGTLHDRKIYAQSAINLFSDHPLFGSGAGSFRIVGTADEDGASIYSTNAHNSLLQFAAEFGVVGLALLGYVLWQILRLIKLTDSQLVVIAATLGLTLHFLIEIDLIYPPLVFLLASLSALSISVSDNKKV